MENNLVIGVELEVLFWTDFGQGHYQKHPTTENAILRDLMFKKLVVQQALHKQGFPSFVANPLMPQHTLTHPRQTHWKIEEDGSIEPLDNDSRHELEDLYWLGIEVSSPPLPFSRGETPPSTGLHVHISWKPGYTLEHLKGVFALSSVAHKQFRQFHPIRRIMSRYCICPSIQFVEQTPSAMGLAVQNCEDLPSLINLVHTPIQARLQPQFYDVVASRSRYTAINFMNIASGKQHTIEFRTHCGTLIGSEIIRWIATCATIVRAGSEYSSLVVPLIEKIEQDHLADGRNYTAAHLLADLGEATVSHLWADSLQLHNWGPTDICTYVNGDVERHLVHTEIFELDILPQGDSDDDDSDDDSDDSSDNGSDDDSDDNEED